MIKARDINPFLVFRFRLMSLMCNAFNLIKYINDLYVLTITLMKLSRQNRLTRFAEIPSSSQSTCCSPLYQKTFPINLFCTSFPVDVPKDVIHVSREQDCIISYGESKLIQPFAMCRAGGLQFDGCIPHWSVALHSNCIMLLIL